MDPALAALARRQSGALSLRQAREAGWEDALRRRIAAGEWRELANGVAVPSGCEVDDELARAIAALSLRGPWAFASLTGLQILNVQVPYDGPPLIAVGPGGVRARVFGKIPMRISDTDLRTRRTVNGVPVLATAVLIRQAAGTLSEDRLTTIVESAVRQKRVTLAELAAVCRSGQVGSGRLRRLLDVLMHEGIDRWARVLARALRKAGVRSEAEWWLRFEGRAHPFDLKVSDRIVVEIDDWETHGLIGAQDRDREQDRWAHRAGLSTVRTTPREVRDRIGVVSGWSCGTSSIRSAVPRCRRRATERVGATRSRRASCRRADQPVCVTSTEQGAWCVTEFGTLPSSRPLPVMPRLPTTMRSASTWRARSHSASAADRPTA
jgi:hypothetical protein